MPGKFNKSQETPGLIFLHSSKFLHVARCASVCKTSSQGFRVGCISIMLNKDVLVLTIWKVLCCQSCHKRSSGYVRNSDTF